MAEILFKEESFEIIGACMKTHSALGCGYKEAIYQDALEVELKRRSIFFEREKKYKVIYEGVTLKHHFIADFVIHKNIIIELKSTKEIINPFIAQTINYLKASGLKLGIIINFGLPSLEYKRIVF
ncbi:GxxExxY protein [Pelobium sp.]|nr:GxxExxY protein [Pelobium sp.]MDA9555592.1 GxxExxY protein [Pelobium sp.]